VATALRLFSERGTSGVSMRELADGAEVTVPGVYYHFDSKAELVQAVYRARGLGQGLDHDLGPLRSDHVEARVVEQAAREFARLLDDEEFLRLMQREAVLGDTDALEVGGTLAIAWREGWCDVLRGSADLEPTTDVVAAAEVIVTFLWGLFVEYLNHHDPTVAERIETFAAIVSPALTRSTS